VVVVELMKVVLMVVELVELEVVALVM